MKAIEWDSANQRYKERTTGRVLSATSLPGDMEDGDLWIDTSTEAISAGARLDWLLTYQQVITIMGVGI